MNASATPRRRRRWLWVVAGVMLLGMSVLPATYLFIRWQGNRELAAVRAELDAADPNWRMPDLFVAREVRLRKLPINSANTVVSAVKLLPEDWGKSDASEQWPNGEAPPNRLPTDARAEQVRNALREVADALVVARRLRDQPDGGTVWPVADFSTYFLNIDLSPVQDRRMVAYALTLDAAVAATDGDPVHAVRSAHAGLHLARSIGDDPFLICQLVRAALTIISVRSAERVLGLCEPADGLPELQAAYTREATEPAVWHGLRGELASFDQILHNMRAGTVAGGGGVPNGYTLSPFYPHDHAFGLRLLHQAVRDCDDPKQGTAVAERIEAEIKAEPRYQIILTRLLTPAVQRCLVAELNRRAGLSAAEVALACERHRRATGHWPDTLAQLPKELLPAVPTDPFDGQPLRYKKTTDGVVVYSVGEDKIDDGGRPQARDGRRPLLGDIVFRLYDPAYRRLPALPPAPTDSP